MVEIFAEHCANSIVVRSLPLCMDSVPDIGMAGAANSSSAVAVVPSVATAVPSSGQPVGDAA
ncbi:MAG: hypothetical protein D6761_06520 [Candidatus Dadabacteria bacterium]|nr:MAG: hypothetical protein D6761_06520 [Candidatus Dadabacteria bacterium]